MNLLKIAALGCFILSAVCLGNVDAAPDLGAAAGSIPAGANSVSREGSFERFQSSVDAARAALSNGNGAAAARGYQALLEQAPNHPLLQLGLARSLVLFHRPAEALRTYRRIADEGFGGIVIQDAAFAKLNGRHGFRKLNEDARSGSSVLQPAEVAFTLPDSRTIPEGLAFDQPSGRFFISSTYLRKIVVRGPDGAFNDFVGAGDNGLLQVLGLKVDPVRHWLLVCTGADDDKLDEFKATDVGRSALFIYDLSNGRLVGSLWGDRARVHLFNDLVLTPSGAVYITDSREGRVYRFAAEQDGLTPLTSADAFVYPNGIAADPSGRWLYVADARGLWRVDTRNGRIRPVSHGNGISTVGIDGLYYRRRALVGVQSDVNPNRVVIFSLSKNGRTITGQRVIERADPRMSSPTEGVVVDDWLYYIANSEQGRVGENGVLPKDDHAPRTRVLKVRLQGTPPWRQSRAGR